MEKVKNKTKKYEVSIILKNNGYYLARISFKIGGGPSPRFEKSGTTKEFALLSLLDCLIEYIDTSFNSNLITFKIDDIVSKRLIGSISSLEMSTPEIMEKALLIVHKINYINSCILNDISLQNNVIPFCNQSSFYNTPNINVMPFQNTIANLTPLANINNNKVEQSQQIIIEDLALEWLKYRKSLCKKTIDNPNPLSRKTLDNNRNRLKKDILPFFKKNNKLYLSQLKEDCIKSLLKNIKSQNSKNKSYVVLNLLFKYAIQEKNFNYNPMNNIAKPPEKIINVGEDEDNNYIETDSQDIWLDLFEKEHIENNNNPNHLHRDIALLFEIMLLTRITSRRSLSV